MLKRLRYAGLALLIFSLMLSGCSLMSQGENGSGNNSSDGADSSEDGAGAQAAKTSGEQPDFNKIKAYRFSDIARSSSGGIWYYTEEEHPGNLGFIWEKARKEGKEADILHIQLSDKEYYGYKIEPMGIELTDGDVAKVTLKLERDSGGSDAKDNEAARVFIAVRKGALENKKFIVQTDEGEKLNTN